MHNGAGSRKVMKPSRSISVAPSLLVPAVILFVMCGTAHSSLLTMNPRAHKAVDASFSVRPNELFTLDSCSKPWSNVREQYQTQLSPPKIVRNYETLTGHTQTVGSPFYRYGSQSLLIKPGFKRQASMYRLNFLSMIYKKTLLQAGYICSTSGINP